LYVNALFKKTSFTLLTFFFLLGKILFHAECCGVDPLERVYFIFSNQSSKIEINVDSKKYADN